ncbi:MAG: NADH:ubiquinone reductase (Na(+)-transporting) subunit B [Bacteroidales bacterium]|jgi:Na+-transporting NADH:ubiquinone oxidoreductase subunit B|nr:NADH:ubiquinone reductase (Na(+)-transporting) subunit B [Bacteroidales bacterium]MEE3407133.1 NADH:ubiquinone reductase (Na(+)-transporting) subunit B [Candidatus Cryptobacteroides sp.]SKC48133.1 Na+-transporting NADH:ubiquinone oxidoreductase subunit B [Bacteroidales bacterium WCE2008]MBP5740877.1 NADH:ubiquinone reductase (Na(+)-transporting) subunit B [Bacteroidales bacterium]MBQ1857835.1 NADH:ubiquinone reductase (Na(+)-transporting) subunit B [Bacteroidales bacterium]
MEEKKNKFAFLHSTIDAFDTFLRVPGTVTKSGSHVRDAVDLKRVMILVVVALVPAALFGMWNVGYQHNLATGVDAGLWATFFYGFLKVLPLFVVSYGVGLFIEFAGAQIKGEEVNEGYLVSGFLIPLIVPVDVPLWMLAIAVAFAVLFGKEVFGGTGMNFLNPALLARAFLFFSYPTKMSGSEVWIAMRKGEALVDGATGATPLSFTADGIDGLTNAGAQYGTSFMDLFIGTVPGSVGETSIIAILLGAAILLWTGVASWKIMCSSVIGALFVGWLANVLGATTIPAYYQLVLGGFAFGTVFMATDPVTSAQTECGKWIYGFFVGALCVVVRLFNPGYAEGMMLAILLMNTFAPLIDYCVTTSSINRRAKRFKTA